MKTLIIYDDNGVVFGIWQGFYIKPNGGLQYIEVEVPEGKYVSSVDVTVTPNVAIIKGFGSFDYDNATVEEAQTHCIKSSNELLEEYLLNHPFLFSDGLYYSVTREKQNLLSARLLSYQLELQAGIENPELTWNSTGEVCVPWTYQNLVTLALAIKNYVEPLVKKQQEYEKLVRQCTTAKEVSQVVITYETIA